MAGFKAQPPCRALLSEDILSSNWSFTGGRCAAELPSLPAQQPGSSRWADEDVLMARLAEAPQDSEECTKLVSMLARVPTPALLTT